MAVDIAEAPKSTGASAPPTRLRVVDVDVHHGMRDISQLAPYLSQLYRERLKEYGIGGGGGLYAFNGGHKGYRVDTLGPDSPPGIGVAASSVERTRADLLDGAGVDVALLTGPGGFGSGSLTDLDYAGALCRAFNDYSIDKWLGADERFRLAMTLCSRDPEGAVAEIDRIGDDPRVVAIVMPCGSTRPYGQRCYHPIYDACVRHNLTVALHFGGEGNGVNPAPTAAGYPAYYAEARQARPSFYQAHLASFIFEGVFEKFPTLKVAMLEAGFGWVAPYRWRMDADWKGLRRQTPWVKRLPSEYIREHVRFASQPADEPDKPEAIHTLIEWMEGERTLMFASDYPHWDWDDPAQTFTQLPAALRQRIMVENARETFNLS